MDKRMTFGGNGSHWDGCAETHWDCKIAQLEAELAALREQLRLANEDAERLANVVKAYSGITVTDKAYPNDETTFQFAYDALRLHEERITQESE